MFIRMHNTFLHVYSLKKFTCKCDQQALNSSLFIHHFLHLANLVSFVNVKIFGRQRGPRGCPFGDVNSRKRKKKQGESEVGADTGGNARR